MSSESLAAHPRSGSGLASAGTAAGRVGSQQQLLRGGGMGALGSGGPQQAQRRGSMDGLTLGPSSGLSGPLHTRSGSLSGGLHAAADPLQQLSGAPGGEGGPGRVRRTESSETVAADVPLPRLGSMGEPFALPGSPSLARASLDGQAGMPPGARRRGAGGAEAAGRGSALAPAGRLSGATLAPTAAGRGARAALTLATTLEEPGQHPEQLRLLPEAQIP